MRFNLPVVHHLHSDRCLLDEHLRQLAFALNFCVSGRLVLEQQPSRVSALKRYGRIRGALSALLR